jgi:hypothetical protein
MDGAIDSFLNREAESKLGFSWWLYQTLETPIIRFAVKQRNLCITYVRNIRVGKGVGIQINEH